MVNINYYRIEAERCRTLARETQNMLMKDQWLKLARDYQTLADDHEAGPTTVPTLTVPMQQQPVQQQQSKTKPKDDRQP